MAHGENEGNMPNLVSSTVAQARQKTEDAGITVPEDAYGYFWGRRDDGTRFIFGSPV